MKNDEQKPATIKNHQRVEDSRHMVDIDVPLVHSYDVYEIIMATRGTIGYKCSFITPDNNHYDTLSVDLGSLPAIIKEFGIGPVGDIWAEEQREEVKAEKYKRPDYDGSQEAP
jgi:hypothetical protein